MLASTHANSSVHCYNIGGIFYSLFLSLESVFCVYSLWPLDDFGLRDRSTHVAAEIAEAIEVWGVRVSLSSLYC